MDEREQLNRRRQARIRLRAQRRRVGILRTRVITVSVACFVLLWAVVFVQMATGNDPVLGEGRRAAESRIDSEEAGRAAAGAVEAIETTAPEEAEPESEVVEPEPVEVEVIEPEPEPVPVETAQS